MIETDKTIARLEAALRGCFRNTTMEGMEPIQLQGVSKDIALIIARAEGDLLLGTPIRRLAGGRATPLIPLVPRSDGFLHSIEKSSDSSTQKTAGRMQSQ